MKLITLILLSLFPASISWLGDFSAAKSEAVKTHKLILISFSGSDWCGPCIRFKKEILESGAFEEYASHNLILVRADFPREKKNQPAIEQIKLNEALADKYNSDGKFPFTLLTDENGKTLKTWDGFPNEDAEKFVSDIKHITNLSKPK